MKIKKKTITISIFAFITIICLTGYYFYNRYINSLGVPPEIAYQKMGDFMVKTYQTNKCSTRRNCVQAIVLHHTAFVGDIHEPLHSLCFSNQRTSCHVLINYDGTRYELATPDKVTWHAGYSYLNGKECVNNFSIGIEFQGNTKIIPLTKSQINSCIEYLLPIIKKYNISLDNIVTHEQIRHDWIVHNPQKAKEKNVPEKIDISEAQYKKFMKRLQERMNADK